MSHAKLGVKQYANGLFMCAKYYRPLAKESSETPERVN